MKKALSTALWIGLLVIFASMYYQAIAQVTNAAGIDYALAFKPTSDSRLTKYVIPHTDWGNSRGDMATAVLPDSASLWSAFGANTKIWVITLTDTTRQGSSEDGTINFSIIDLDRTETVDTSLFISQAGLYCTGLLPHIDVIISPYDSLEKYDQLVVTWLCRQWQ